MGATCDCVCAWGGTRGVRWDSQGCRVCTGVLARIAEDCTDGKARDVRNCALGSGAEF